jgi:hypothetical protein
MMFQRNMSPPPWGLESKPKKMTLGLLFNHEDGGNKFVPNVSWLLLDYTGLPHRRPLHITFSSTFFIIFAHRYLLQTTSFRWKDIYWFSRQLQHFEATIKDQTDSWSRPTADRFVRLEILMAVVMKKMVFWVVSWASLLLLLALCSAYSSTLKMGATGYSKTSSCLRCYTVLKPRRLYSLANLFIVESLISITMQFVL